MVQVILLSGVIISVFLSALLLKKGSKSVSESLLMFWIITTGYLIGTYWLVYSGRYTQYPSLTVSGFCFPLLPGPLMYLYIKYQTKAIFFQKKDLLHFAPFIACSMLFLPFYFMPFVSKVSLLINEGVGYEIENGIRTILIHISGVVYILLSFFRLYRFKVNLKREFSNSEKIDFNWMVLLNIGLLVIWIIVWFVQDDRLIFSSSAVYIILIGFFGISQVNVFTEKEILFNELAMENQPISEAEKSVKNPKTVEEKELPKAGANLQETYQKAAEMLKEKKMYLDPEIKLLDLAILLNIHPNLLSKAINETSEANFHDLINKMRVEEFITRIKAQDANKYTLIAIAYDSGFNSKASFNRNFKAVTGISPTTYIKSLS